jgi:hypothetical protein
MKMNKHEIELWKQAQRQEIILGWANNVSDACTKGLFGKSLLPKRINCISGPRVAILDIYPGQQAEDIYKAFTRASSMSLRQTIGWQYAREPQVFPNGSCIRVEVAWPIGLERGEIPLEALNQKPVGDGRFVIGLLENGATHLVHLNRQSPHLMVAGASGSGKSTVLQSMITQFSKDDNNQIVLLDGKNGEGLRCVSGCPNVVGPLATDAEEIKGALQWVNEQMTYRYEHEEDGEQFLRLCKRIIVVFDEPQEFTDPSLGSTDAAIVEMVRALAVKSRASKIHLVLGTQTPNLEVFGHQATRKQMNWRIVARVENAKASEVALGVTNPSAHNLIGSGDLYCRSDNGAICRVQGAYVDKEILRRKYNQRPQLEYWPTFNAEAMQPVVGFGVDELAAGLEMAARGAGRPWLTENSDMGSTRVRPLLPIVRELWANLKERGFSYEEK